MTIATIESLREHLQWAIEPTHGARSAELFVHRFAAARGWVWFRR